MDRDTRTLRIATPIGDLELIAHAGELEEIRMEPQRGHDLGLSGPPAPHHVRNDRDRRPAPATHSTACKAGDGVLQQARRQLEGYFAGESRSFALPMRLDGTEFQRAVWNALRHVGYGETVTYGELAARIGRPHAARAVGRALARNPLPIVVPCHRVVGHLGELTGFAGGIDRKRLLLELESPQAACLPDR